MAELADVFPMTNDNEYNDMGMPNSTNEMQSGYNNADVMVNHNSQFNNNPSLQQSQPVQNNSSLLNNNNGNNGTNGIDNTIEKLENQIKKQKKINSLKQEMKKQNNEPTSLLDSYVKRKKDMYKIVLIAMLIVLALSTHDIIKYYLSKYIHSNDLTSRNELYIRLSVPLGVCLLIWTMKALNK